MLQDQPKLKAKLRYAFNDVGIMVLGRAIKNILMMEELVFINSHAYYCYDFSSNLSNNLSITCNLIKK